MTPTDQCPKCKHPWDLHGDFGCGVWMCACPEKRPAVASGEQGEMFVKEGEYPE